MPGWTMTGNLNSKQTLGVTGITPPVVPFGQATWWPNFVAGVGKEFVRQATVSGVRLSVMQVSAHNAGGDTQGLGTLTIVLTAS
jgi:hypothetical protein